MDVKEFEMLYKCHYRAVHNYLFALTKNRELADDLTQDAFLKYEDARVSFRGECSEYTMLCKIGKNIWLNQIRKDRKIHFTDDLSSIEDDKLFVKNELLMEEALIQKSDLLQLHDILHELPEPYKEVFTLRVFGELEFQQIAKMFGKSTSWAKMTYYRAKSKIVGKMEEQK